MKEIRVVVAEDSLTARALLVELFASDPEFKVVGEAGNGEDAVALTKKLRPDLVTMDVRMPRMDGLEATRCIMVEVPTPIVVVSATLDDDDVTLIRSWLVCLTGEIPERLRAGSGER